MEVACAVHRTPSQGGGPHGLWTGSQSGRAAVEGTPFLYGPQVPVSCAPPGASCPSNDSNGNSNRGNNDKNRYIFYRLSTARNLATYEAERIFHSFKDEVTETRGLDPWPRPGGKGRGEDPAQDGREGSPCAVGLESGTCPLFSTRACFPNMLSLSPPQVAVGLKSPPPWEHSLGASSEGAASANSREPPSFRILILS